MPMFFCTGKKKYSWERIESEKEQVVHPLNNKWKLNKTKESVALQSTQILDTKMPQKAHHSTGSTKTNEESSLHCATAWKLWNFHFGIFEEAWELSVTLLLREFSSIKI